MDDQPQLLFQDAESVTRREVLSVVHARAESVADFGAGYFGGFDTFRGLTYTSGIPMIAALLRDHNFRDFECIFGHSGILPPERPLPAWCAPMTLAEYQQRAFERPRRILAGLLGPDRYSPERRPPEKCWTVSGDNLLVAVAPIEFTRTRSDIPDRLLDDTASASGQIALNRKLTEDFLGRPVRRYRRWAWWRR